ncbi:MULTISPECIES: sensor histidine kinase [unclassified Janthinobacterium]|uniref:sensor histidine kinase n=1 Tax=unclassified Janthinobacterium TaxID=2610881 RepID=UPI001622812E|nr:MULTISPECIES: ATP-binding protein [unclassified Janthinobacterium]
MRLSLLASQVEPHFLFNTLYGVRAYLGVIHSRLPRLAFRVDCADDLRHCAIPPLMLISLVENAVTHGIEPKKGAVEIVVNVARRQSEGQQQLLLTVADDGVGFGGSTGGNTSGSGIGLSNIRERLQHLYGGQASLSLTTRDGGGLQAGIVLPLQALPGKDH